MEKSKNRKTNRNDMRDESRKFILSLLAPKETKINKIISKNIKFYLFLIIILFSAIFLFFIIENIRFTNHIYVWENCGSHSTITCKFIWHRFYFNRNKNKNPSQKIQTLLLSHPSPLLISQSQNTNTQLILYNSAILQTIFYFWCANPGFCLEEVIILLLSYRNMEVWSWSWLQQQQQQQPKLHHRNTQFTIHICI